MPKEVEASKQQTKGSIRKPFQYKGDFRMKQLSKNKRGMSGILLLVIAVILFAGVGFAVYKFTQSGIGQSEAEQCSDSTGILTVQAVSALDGASDPSSPTITCGVEGSQVKTSVTSGSTTFAVGDELTCLVSKSDYIDTSFTTTMKCGGTVEEVEMYYSTSDNPGIRIKNDDGDFMTDSIAGGATNQTSLSEGETLNLEVEFQGTNTEGSGKGIWVIEFPASSSANITSITLSGASQKAVAIPTVHSLQNAGSKAIAFEIENIVGADKVTKTLSINFATGKLTSTGVYTDWYAIQEFVDDDGYLSEGVEDSDGTAKYENTLAYDFYINAPA